MSTERGPIETLGPYVLESIIGAGGFGTVYRARDTAGRAVALKVLAPHAGSDETLRRFEREGTIRIEHPNVVRVMDAGSASGLSYIAFELLEGKRPCRPTPSWTWASRSARAWRPRTRAAWSTATSSPATSSCAKTASSRSSTSGSRGR